MKGLKCLSKMKTVIVLLFALTIILITPNSASAVDVIYRPGIAVATKLSGPDAAEIERKYYSDTTQYQVFNMNLNNYQYIRMFFNAFNPNNRDFSLSFLYENFDRTTSYENIPLEVNVLGAFNIDVKQEKLSSFNFEGQKIAVSSGLDNLTIAEYDNLIMVNVTGNLAIDYYGTSTDHIDLYVGLHNRPIYIYRPMVVISEDNILNDEMNFRHWVQNYLENLDLNFDTSAIVDAQEDTTSAVNSLRSDTQAQTQEIQQGNEEAQDRWEADKQEESDREDSLGDDSDALGGVFDFEIRNPFGGLLTMFTNQCPVSIPTIASMVGASSSTYPCWFDGQTRNILTPVISISASMVLFGFIIRGFLNKGNFSGGIEV